MVSWFWTFGIRLIKIFVSCLLMVLHGRCGFFFFCLSFFLCFINNWCPCFQVTELEALELWDILESGWEESEGERWTQHVVR